MLFLKVVLVVSKPQYEWVKNGDAPPKERQLQNGLRTALRALKSVSAGMRESTVRTATDVGTDPSCHVLSVQWRVSAESPESGAKSRAFREKTGNIRNLAALCSTMIFARRHSCGNEAILGGQYTAIEDCCEHSLEVCGSRVYTPPGS